MIDNIKKFSYLFLIENDETILKRKIIRTIYKATLNKTFKINKITNRTLKQLVCVVSKQIRFLFNKCIKKEMQSFYFKKTITIMLRKLEKKDYLKLLSFRFIALLNTLNKMLKLIILKRLCYVVKAYNTLFDIQIKIRK